MSRSEQTTSVQLSAARWSFDFISWLCSWLPGSSTNLENCMGLWGCGMNVAMSLQLTQIFSSSDLWLIIWIRDFCRHKGPTLLRIQWIFAPISLHRSWGWYCYATVVLNPTPDPPPSIQGSGSDDLVKEIVGTCVPEQFCRLLVAHQKRLQIPGPVPASWQRWRNLVNSGIDSG